MSDVVRILLVEDSAVDAALLNAVIRKGGINPRIHRVETGADFQKALEDEQWDVVLSDYSLPNFDGLEALRIVREQMPDIPFIMVSGTTGEEFAVEVMRSGAQDFITKQNLTRLVSAINRELQQQRERAQLLRAATLKMDVLVELLPDLIFYKDAEGYYRMVNNGFLAFHEITRQTAIGKKNVEFMQTDWAAQTSESDRQTQCEKRTMRYEMQYKKDGKLVYLDIVKVPLFELEQHDFIGILGVARDITEQKENERALLEGQKVLAERNASLQKAWVQTIAVLGQTAEAKDPYTAGHQKRVAKLASAMAQKMNLEEETVQSIHMAALLHDIGKIQIPGELLSKPGRLSDLEMELIRTHSKVGWEIMSTIDLPWNLAEIIYQHHERLNGSGYPRRLQEGEILLEAKIIAVADVTEAMMSHRPYRAALGIDQALEEIEKGKGALYDPAAAAACISLFAEDGFAF